MCPFSGRREDGRTSTSSALAILRPSGTVAAILALAAPPYASYRRRITVSCFERAEKSSSSPRLTVSRTTLRAPTTLNGP